MGYRSAWPPCSSSLPYIFRLRGINIKKVTSMLRLLEGCVQMSRLTSRMGRCTSSCTRGSSTFLSPDIPCRAGRSRTSSYRYSLEECLGTPRACALRHPQTLKQEKTSGNRKMGILKQKNIGLYERGVVRQDKE